MRSSSATEAPSRWRSDDRIDTLVHATGRRSVAPVAGRPVVAAADAAPDTLAPVKSSLEPLEGNKVKLSVNIDEAEFDQDIDQAFRKIAREVRLPGFRAGKAPRRVLEARIGIAPAREQALRDSIPQYLAKAVREHDVDLIATPEVEITAGAGGRARSGSTPRARCVPRSPCPGYGGLRVELPAPEPTDAEVDEAIAAAAAAARRSSPTSSARRPAATTSRSTSPPPATARTSPG